MHWIWNNTGVRFASVIPDKLKIPLGAILVISVILIGAFASPESQDNTLGNRAVSLFGLAGEYFWLCLSKNEALGPFPLQDVLGHM